jgi:hypothetical protein
MNKLIIFGAVVLALYLLYIFTRPSEKFQLQNECPICFESIAQMVPVCANTYSQYQSIVQNLLASGLSAQDADRTARYLVPLHEVCRGCAMSLNKCPICRGPKLQAVEPPEFNLARADSDSDWGEDDEYDSNQERGFEFGSVTQEQLDAILSRMNNIEEIQNDVARRRGLTPEMIYEYRRTNEIRGSPELTSVMRVLDRGSEFRGLALNAYHTRDGDTIDFLLIEYDDLVNNLNAL